MKQKSLFAPLLFLALLFLSGWGFLVHRTVAQLAIYELPRPMQSFFFANKDSLVHGAPRPDKRRSKDKSEATRHFMDMERYGEKPFQEVPHDFQKAIVKYSLDTLNKYGTLPYVVVDYMHKLTQAFRSQNKDSIVFYAADLSHYISDAHVPLHTSLNYDGQLTGQNGIHDLWETAVPEIEITQYNLGSRHKAKYLASPETEIWNILEHTFSLIPEMLEKEREVSKKISGAAKYRWQVRWGKNRRFYSRAFAKEYSKALQSSINDQLIASSNALADFWYTAWVDAGRPNLNALSTPTRSKKYFKRERKAFRKNQLIKKGRLISFQQTDD